MGAKLIGGIIPLWKYNSYLKSPSWRQKRKALLTLRGTRCEMCQKDHSESLPKIHVHHIHYRSFGNEPLKDLVLLCADCHRLVHNPHSKKGKVFLDRNRSFKKKSPKKKKNKVRVIIKHKHLELNAAMDRAISMCR